MTHPGPAVSVLVPVRDAGEALPRCIRSLETQSLQDVEFVAVDDGSRDGSRGVLESWAARDSRVRLLSTRPTGLVGALERGRSLARGFYIARMDADDVAHPQRLELQLALMEADPDLVGCGTLIRYFPRRCVRDGARRYERWLNSLVEPDDIERDAFVECPLAHPTLFVRSDALDAVGGYRDRGWPEDYDLFLRLRAAGGRFRKVPRVLLRWREGPRRLSRTSPTYSLDAFRRCKVHFLLAELRRRVGPDPELLLWGSGPTGKSFARALRRGGARLRAFVDVDPRKVGQRIQGVPVVSLEDAGRHRDAVALACVGRRRGRAEIRESCRTLGWTEGRDFWAVA